MINSIIAFSIKNKLIIGLLTLTLVGAGIWSMTQVPVDAVPDITNNQVQVITQAPNLGTEDIEQFVTYPVELGMANLPGVVEIRSISRFGLSVVTIVFEDEMGTYLPRQLVAQKLAEVQEEIPEGFGKPAMGPISSGLGEIYQYTLEVDPAHAGEYDITDLRTIQDWIIRRQMTMVPGVVEVNAFGGNIKQYEVAVDPDELRAMNLTITDLFEALERNNQNTGGAYIERNHQAYFIRGEGLARTVEDIENIVVESVNGVPMRVKDVAEVQIGSAVRYGAFTKDGEGEAVGGMILMLKGANSNEVVQAVQERMAEIEETLPEGVHIEPFLDRSKLIANTTSTVTGNLLEGALIVILVLVFLLGNWRGGLIVASTIPLSLLFAFVLMNVFDVWANLMSLGAIDFGIIVDGAVIIVEGTVFYLSRHLRSGESITGAKRDKLTYTASTRMMNSAFFGQLIILIVFLPILFLEGVEGKMFKPMAFTFMFAMLGAMILCLTYVPMMSSLFLRVSGKDKKSWGDKVVLWVEVRYERLLQRSLRRGRLLLIAALGLLMLAGFTFSRMGGEFIPQLDEGDIAFHIILKPGSSLSEATETSTQVEQILLENFPEVQHAMTRFGVADVPTDPMPMDIGDCFVILKPPSEWVSADSKEELITKMKDKLSIIPGVNYEFTQPIEMRFNELLTGVREDVAIKLYGEDLDILAEKAEEMGAIIATVEGVADMRVEATSGLPQMTVHYERDDLAQYGLNINDINTVIETAFAGGKAGVIFEGERRFDLVVRLDSSDRRNIDDIRNLYINTPDGAQIPLKEVANISYQPGPMQISRDNTNRRVYVGVNVRGRDIKSLVTEIQEKLREQLELPPGYYIRYGGAFENLERATSRLKLVVPLALALIFLMIYFALRSVKQSVMIYMAIPLAAIGGIFSLWLRGMPFSISAGIGFIVLFGVAVLNGLVLINGWNELKSEGMADLNERIRKGARRRIRPILLTALTDIFGFLPMAISTSAGAEVQRPLATVVIGGLITATLLTLFILPILYRWTEKHSIRKFFGRRTFGAIAIVGLFFTAQPAFAQADTLPEITLQQAIDRAVANFPEARVAQLEIERQQAQSGAAWNLGRTEFFTGGEELGGEAGGVHTLIGVQQQGIDIFGVPARRRVQQQNELLAENQLQLTGLQIAQRVRQAYANVYVLKLYLRLHQDLDSIYQNFEAAAELRLQVEEISRLEYLAATTQAKKVNFQKEQAEMQYRAALYRFNLWLNEETLYTVSTSPENPIAAPLALPDSISHHPLLQVAQAERELAGAELQLAKAQFLPRLNAAFGLQRTPEETGLYQYEIGISVPLFFFSEQANVQSARIQQQIAEQEYVQTQLELKWAYIAAYQEYQQLLAAWEFFNEEALPLAREQREAALFAYREGAIDYVTLIQNLTESVEVELQALEALSGYLDARSDLEFYRLSTINQE